MDGDVPDEIFLTRRTLRTWLACRVLFNVLEGAIVLSTQVRLSWCSRQTDRLRPHSHPWVIHVWGCGPQPISSWRSGPHLGSLMPFQCWGGGESASVAGSPVFGAFRGPGSLTLFRGAMLNWLVNSGVIYPVIH